MCGWPVIRDRWSGNCSDEKLQKDELSTGMHKVRRSQRLIKPPSPAPRLCSLLPLLLRLLLRKTCRNRRNKTLEFRFTNSSTFSFCVGCWKIEWLPVRLHQRIFLYIYLYKMLNPAGSFTILKIKSFEILVPCCCKSLRWSPDLKFCQRKECWGLADSTQEFLVSTWARGPAKYRSILHTFWTRPKRRQINSRNCSFRDWVWPQICNSFLESWWALF